MSLAYPSIEEGRKSSQNIDMLTQESELKSQFESEGYAIAKGRFSAEECDALSKYFTDMVERGGDGYAENWNSTDQNDPLVKYPRLLQPHRSDSVAFNFMVDPRIAADLTDICETPPLAVQTMVYFKPAGARGQALHQDQRYLNVHPGTCVAAWLALDDCDDENGCMSVVSGTHNIPVLCPISSDPEQSWTGETVPVPPGMTVKPIHMKRGDVLYFNGQLIHGSGKNTSKDRFRRTLIAHYIDGAAESVSKYYFPVWNLEGEPVTHIQSGTEGEGGPCGVPHEQDGKVHYEMVGSVNAALAAH